MAETARDKKSNTSWFPIASTAKNSRLMFDLCVNNITKDNKVPIKVLFITLSIPNIENPPMKRAEADPDAFLASLNIALMEIEISDLISFDLSVERTKCSGE